MELDFGFRNSDTTVPGEDSTYTPEVIPELTAAERTALILKEVAASRLNSEIKSRDFYSVCALSDIAAMSGDDRFDFRRTSEFHILKALHCVHYNAMTDAVKRNITELTLNAIEPMIGTLRVSDKTYCGVRLFETAYLPESYKSVETPVAVAVPKKSVMARILSGFGVRAAK